MSASPLTLPLTHGINLELTRAGDEIVAKLYLGDKVVEPSARAVANSERVRTVDGALHIGRCAFYIPEAQRRTVRDWLNAQQVTS
jgi:hypothetical protein